MNLQCLLFRSSWLAPVVCALAVGCGDAGTQQSAAPTQSVESLEAKRKQIAKELAAAEAKRTELVENFVRDFLSDGPLPKAAVVTAAQEIGIESDEVAEAAERLGIETIEGEGGLHWKLPE